MLFKTSGPVVDYFLKVWMLLQFKSGHPQVQVVVCARWTEIPLRQCLRNKCLQDRLQWRIGRGTTQNLLPTPSPKGGTIKPSDVDTNVASTNSPPVSGPACCSAVPGGNWGCCRQPVSASQSNTWRRRWLGRWCWTGAVPGSGAPSHSCRTWNKADSRSTNSNIFHSSYDDRQQQGCTIVFCSMTDTLMDENEHPHVLHCDIFEDLTVVDIPHCLVIPDFGGQQNGTENNSLPVTRTDIHLSVCQQPFQVHLTHRRYHISHNDQCYF